MYNYVDRTQGICLGQFDICLCLLVQTLYSFICFGYTSDGYGQYQGECIYDMSTHTLFRRALREQNKLLHFNTRSQCMFICTHILMYIYINEQVVFHGNTGNMERAYGKTRFIWFVFFFLMMGAHCLYRSVGAEQLFLYSLLLLDNAEVNPQTIMLVVVVICNAYIDRLSITDDKVGWERRNENGRKRIMIVFVIYYVVTTESLLDICLECKYQNIRPDKIKNSNETKKQNARP